MNIRTKCVCGVELEMERSGDLGEPRQRIWL